MHLKEGTILQGGKYRIIRFISSGGFGCTYEAIDTMMDSHVAIKEFFVSDYCNRDEKTGVISIATKSQVNLLNKLRQRFVEEARAVFQLSHPNIVRVFNIFDENGTSYFVMDFIKGESLHSVLERRKKLPEAEALGYIRQICDALEYVHAQPRLHLDIKPANIMVDKDGHATLIDFGASKHYDEETHEQTSTMLGINTRGYAPSEQMSRSFTGFNPATDIYALGATLYKLLTGITPPDSIGLLNGDEELPPMPSDISAATQNAIKAAMQPRRKDRPQSIAEFVALLNGDEVTEIAVAKAGGGGNNADNDGNANTTTLDVNKNIPPVTPPPTDDNKNGSEPDDNKRKKIILFCVLGVLVALAIGLAIYFISHRGPVYAGEDDAVEFTGFWCEEIYPDTVVIDSVPFAEEYIEDTVAYVDEAIEAVEYDSKPASSRDYDYDQYEAVDSVAY